MENPNPFNLEFIELIWARQVMEEVGERRKMGRRWFCRRLTALAPGAEFGSFVRVEGST